MYLPNIPITVNWKLGPTTNAVVSSDLAIRTIDPDKTVTIYNILSNNFIAPKIDAYGLVEFTFTPSKIGVWIVILYSNMGFVEPFSKEYKIRVSNPDTHIYQQIKPVTVNSSLPPPPVNLPPIG